MSLRYQRARSTGQVRPARDKTTGELLVEVPCDCPHTDHGVHWRRVGRVENKGSVRKLTERLARAPLSEAA